MTRKVKEILKLVAESSSYTPVGSRTSSSYMCYALIHAKNAGLISEGEEELANKAIKKYLNMLSNNSNSLHVALGDNGLPSSFGACLDIYLDWKKRPKPWKD